MKILGLTGSIGMGKSTTLGFFRDMDVPVWDADEAVHRLYGPGGAAARAVAGIVPDAVGPEGVDRTRLRAAILADPMVLGQVEQAVHPLVSADRDAFLARARAGGHALAVCDIPLLFEIGRPGWMDAVLVMTAPHHVQRARVLARPGMTEEAFEAIHARQVPDAEKRAAADFIIDSSEGHDEARAHVARIVAALGGTEGGDHA